MSLDEVWPKAEVRRQKTKNGKRPGEQEVPPTTSFSDSIKGPGSLFVKR